MVTKDELKQTYIDGFQPPNKPPCCMANAGDHIEDLAHKIMALSKKEKEALLKDLNRQLGIQ